MNLRRRRSLNTGFDERLSARIESTIEQLQKANKWNDETEGQLADAITSAIFESAPSVAIRWQREGRAYRRRYGRFVRKFHRQLQKDYGAGLDSMQTFVAVSVSLGSGYSASERVEHRDKFVFHALSGLHARACRVALEVHALLSVGFPQAALARARTLHEINVVAAILSDHEESHPDLAERYVLHEAMLNLGDARVYQRDAERLGLDPIDEEFMASLIAKSEALVARFDPPYKKPFGWASELIGNSDPKFDQLERLAGQSRLRSHYKWASREVHADSKGLRLNMIERGGNRMLLAGPTNLGLVEPASSAVGSLLQVTVCLLLDPSNAAPSANLFCAALNHLAPEVGELMVRGENAVKSREEKIQARVVGRTTTSSGE